MNLGRFFSQFASNLFRTAVEIEPVEVVGGTIRFRCRKSLEAGIRRVKIGRGRSSTRLTVEVSVCEDGVYRGRVLTPFKGSEVTRPKRFAHQFIVESGELPSTVTDNISFEGLKVTLPNQVRVKQQVSLKLNSPAGGSGLAIDAVCVWCRPTGDGQFEAGFHFPDVKEWEKRWLQRRFMELGRKQALATI